MPYRDRQTGFSLIELMIALTLGIMVTGAVLNVFLQSKRSYSQNELLARMQEDARFALAELTRDLSMANFFADVLDPSAIAQDASLDVGEDCGPVAVANWIYRLRDPGTGFQDALTSVDNATVAEADAAYSCLGDDVVPGSDIIAIKRVLGDPADVIDANNVYIRSNGTLALLYKSPMSAAPPVTVQPPFQDWAFVPTIYYVRNFAVTAGDGIPTLCRKSLEPGGPPDMVTECLAQGIEALQIEYGVDDDLDGAPNRYEPDPTAAEMAAAVSARIYLLARSVAPDISYDNDKTYQISNAPALTPDDNFYRRIYATTIGVRNIRNMRTLDL